LKTEGNFIYSIGNNRTKNKIHLPPEVITLAAAVNTIQTKNIAALVFIEGMK
jgi:hypothetical protein